jgi:hypothetical protein
VGINKDKHARIIIMRPETILHSEAGYIFADCSRPTRFFLQFGGGPYILRQQPEDHPTMPERLEPSGYNGGVN